MGRHGGGVGAGRSSFRIFEPPRVVWVGDAFEGFRAHCQDYITYPTAVGVIVGSEFWM